jgi:hypothetical protein
MSYKKESLDEKIVWQGAGIIPFRWVVYGFGIFGDRDFFPD